MGKIALISQILEYFAIYSQNLAVFAVRSTVMAKTEEALENSHDCYNLPAHQIDILLYLGSFDPPHLGHAAVIKHALKIVKPKELHCVVTNRHWDGKDLSPVVDRIEMLRRFTKAIGRNVSVNTIDVEEDLSGCNAETIYALKIRHPQKTFGILLGTDHLATFPTWKDVSKITGNAVCFFAPRPGTSWAKESLIPGVVLLPPLHSTAHSNVSSLKIKRILHENSNARTKDLTYTGVARYVVERNVYAGFFERHPQLL